MIGSCRPGFNPQYRRNFSVGIFQDLSTLTDLNLIVSMVKSDLMDTYTITDSCCGSKSKWALVHLCTCKAAANRSNVYVSGNNNKILPIPETIQGISTSVDSKEERSKKKKKCLSLITESWSINWLIVDWPNFYAVDWNLNHPITDCRLPYLSKKWASRILSGCNQQRGGIQE